MLAAHQHKHLPRVCTWAIAHLPSLHPFLLGFCTFEQQYSNFGYRTNTFRTAILSTRGLNTSQG